MMPTYDYICDACAHEFEAFEPITSQPQTECPVCKEPRLRRKIGPGAAILFKGSGFYQTDYRSESYRKAAEADKSSGKTTTGAEKSSEGTSKASGDSGAAGSTTPPPKPTAASSKGEP